MYHVGQRVRINPVHLETLLRSHPNTRWITEVLTITRVYDSSVDCAYSDGSRADGFQSIWRDYPLFVNAGPFTDLDYWLLED